VQKTTIRDEAAKRMSRLNKLKAYLIKDKIVVFTVDTKQGRQLYIGGEMKPSELRPHLQKVQLIKVQPVFLRAFQNKRSYRIILDEILGT
jgi:hypothetical protein